MTPIPRSLGGRIAVVAWLIAWGAILVIAFVQRDIRHIDMAVTYFLLLLSFPLGYVVGATVAVIFKVLYELAGIVVPGGFLFNFATWFVMGAAGYIQWFVLVPWCLRKWKAGGRGHR